jgi:exodeoxyribonuclease V alpha subunit
MTNPLQKARIEHKLENEFSAFLDEGRIDSPFSLSNLHELGLSQKLIDKVHDAWGNNEDDLIARIKANPYTLTEIEGIGFKRADAVALKLGIKEDSPYRIEAAAFNYLVNGNFSSGHILNWYKAILSKMKTDLGMDTQTAENVLQSSAKFTLLLDEEKPQIALTKYLTFEQRIADKLNELNSVYPLVDDIGHLQDILDDTLDIKAATGIDLSFEQRQAIQSVFFNKVTIITGGPGTGKTTLLRGLNHIARKSGFSIVYSAFVGRAARRIEEAIGGDCESYTIHKLLKYSPIRGFTVNRHSPLEYDILVVDEMSMVDTSLFYHLMQAVDAKKTRIVLVGDINQLPSIGPGQVLKDLLDSDAFNTIRLTKPFRQAEQSAIVRNAYHILRGEQVEAGAKTVQETDFHYIRVEDMNMVAPTVLDLYLRGIPKHTSFKSVDDIQILAPMYDGPSGVTEINDMIQRELFQGNSDTFFLGDKVINWSNNYEKGIMNGDVGKVIRKEATGGITVSFGLGKEVRFKRSEIDDITLAYCVTVHKAQGSEYPVVIIPMVKRFRPMMNRQLLYTAVTRGARMVIIVGQQEALRGAIADNTTFVRRTTLLEKLVKPSLPATAEIELDPLNEGF